MESMIISVCYCVEILIWKNIKYFMKTEIETINWNVYVEKYWEMIPLIWGKFK